MAWQVLVVKARHCALVCLLGDVRPARPFEDFGIELLEFTQSLFKTCVPTRPFANAGRVDRIVTLNFLNKALNGDRVAKAAQAEISSPQSFVVVGRHKTGNAALRLPSSCLGAWRSASPRP